MQKAKEKYSKEKAEKAITKEKKSQESVIKTCHKTKKTILKSTKEKISRLGSV